MSSRNLLVGFLGVVALGLGLLLWQSYLENRTLQAQALFAREGQARAEAERDHAAKKIQELTARLAATETGDRVLSPTGAANPPDTKSKKKDKAAARLLAEGASGMSPSPDMVAIKGEAAKIRLQMERRYGDFAKTLGLTPEQTDQFMKLMVDRKQVASDVAAAGLQQDDALIKDPAAFSTLLEGAKQDTENQLHQLLGDDNYAQLQDWEHAVGQSSSLQRLQFSLDPSTRLNDDQMTQLQGLLDQNKAGHITAQVLTAAQKQGFLTAAQQAALQDLYQQQQTAQKLRRTPPLPASTSP